MNSNILKEIIFNKNVGLSLEDILSICKTNKEFYDICKKYKCTLSEKLLNFYKVNYNDPNNFIYIANKTDINKIKDNVDFTFKAFKLYLKFYYLKDIKFEDKEITSFPIYPNMVECNFTGNKLKTFEIQPNMLICYIEKNQLTSFPIQPKMTNFYVSNNQLKSFSIKKKNNEQ